MFLRPSDHRSSVVWHGPFFEHRSLAVVNRELALALLETGRVELYLRYDRPPAFAPDADPRFAPLASRAVHYPNVPAVAIRQAWPPNFRRPQARRFVLIQPWEFGSLPKAWVRAIADTVDEVWVPSTFVREEYLTSGVAPDQVAVVPNGVNTAVFNPQVAPAALPTRKHFKFLFVGGTISRKGVDVLLRAYRQSFSARDDVTLVIKDFGLESFYKGQGARAQINALQAEPGAPEIIYLTGDLDEREIAALYSACDCLVQPYRGEGYCLPIVEAMACGKPTVVTNYGAALDFANPANSYLIPASVVRLREKRVLDMETVDYPYWAEPDGEALAATLRRIYEQPAEAQARGQRAASDVAARHTWTRAAHVAAARLEGLVQNTAGGKTRARRLRVLHLTAEFPPLIWGGLGTAVGGLATASARAGMEVVVLLIGYPNRFTSYGWSDLTEYTEGDAELFVSDLARLKIMQVSKANALATALRLAREWHPDVVHVHPVELWPIARALQQSGTPVVYTVHSLNLAEYELGREPPEILNLWRTQEEILAAADRVLALTESERDLLVQACPHVQERVRVIGNGIDELGTDSRHRPEQTGDDAPLVLYTGRFVDRKGIRDLLAAVPLILAQAPATRFVLVGGYGSGEHMAREWLPREVEQHRGQVHFTGWLSPRAVAEWYAVADILVVPSWYEPFGMVILEGMLYGLPIVAAEVGGPAEILAHGRTGLLFPPKNVAALAENVLRLVTDSELRRRIGLAAAADVRGKWLWPHVVERMRGVYSEAALDGAGSSLRSC
ncbi:MAG TPA: glycosyltransferase family 4 protein [Pyrinomonadaceae bacterium]|jgi:glycosyltransferase involved in cell wall biosynthesis